MGTSTRRMNKKIRDLLQQNNYETFDLAIPDVYKEVMRSKAVNRFYSEEFSVAIGVGIRGLKAINEGTFREEFNFDGSIKDDALTKQKIIESIIDIVGEEAFEEDSLVKTALKYALTESVLKDDEARQLYLFMQSFCSYLMYLLISSQAEVLGENFMNISATEMDDKIKKVAQDIVSNSLNQTILAFLAGQVDIQTLIKAISDKASSFKVIGES